MSKHLALLLIVVLTVSSLPIVESFAQSVPKPSIPEFTLRYVNNSYDVPATTFIDPYTGKNETKPSYHVDARVIEIVIVNQAYNSHLYYDVRTKGHFEENWTTRFGLYNSPKMSTDSKTVLTFSPDDDGDWVIRYPLVPGSNTIHAPAGGQTDFQIEAFVADNEYVEPQPGVFPFGGLYRFALEAESGWSETQTLTIPDSSQSNSTPSIPSPSGQTPEPMTSIWETWQSELVIGIIVVLVLIVSAALFYWKKRKRVGDRQRQ